MNDYSTTYEFSYNDITYMRYYDEGDDALESSMCDSLCDIDYTTHFDFSKKPISKIKKFFLFFYKIIFFFIK